ncbi:MAG: TetR family transcriptional regulator [Solirubrobacterales bacterium]|nr:TetR family transcriptional regulator [Solirubrobacterales bacterium]
MRGGDRRRDHDGTSEQEAAILEAVERLLVKESLAEVSVEKILAEARISRAKFYFYFSGKNAVVTALAASVMEEMFVVMRPYLDRDLNGVPTVSLAEALRGGFRLWIEHRGVLRAVSENWHLIPELRMMWLGVIEGFGQAIGTEIEKEREAGLIPKGIDGRQLASMLVWATAQCAYIAGLRVDDGLPSEGGIFDAILAMWTGTIYGTFPDQRAGLAG